MFWRFIKACCGPGSVGDIESEFSLLLTIVACFIVAVSLAPVCGNSTCSSPTASVFCLFHFRWLNWSFISTDALLVFDIDESNEIHCFAIGSPQGCFQPTHLLWGFQAKGSIPLCWSRIWSTRLSREHIVAKCAIFLNVDLHHTPNHFHFACLLSWLFCKKELTSPNKEQRKKILHSWKQNKKRILG